MAETRNFAVSDTVRLRSGSLPMTVTKIGPEGVSCAWHGQDGELHTATFAAVVLDAAVSAHRGPAPEPPVGGIRSRLAR